MSIIYFINCELPGTANLSNLLRTGTQGVRVFCGSSLEQTPILNLLGRDLSLSIAGRGKAPWVF